MALVDVQFKWSDEKGLCSDCGRPAAYTLPDAYGPNKPIGPEHLRCSVCAAEAAAAGERIVYLFAEPTGDVYVVTWSYETSADESTPEEAANLAASVFLDGDPAAGPGRVELSVVRWDGGTETSAGDFQVAVPRPNAYANSPYPVSSCGCGTVLLYTAEGWQHDAAPYVWGDDHDARPDLTPEVQLACLIYDLRQEDWNGVADDLAQGVPPQTVLSRLRDIGETDSEAFEMVSKFVDGTGRMSSP